MRAASSRGLERRNTLSARFGRGWGVPSRTTIRRAELTEEATMMTMANDLAVRRALEAAGVEFIDENGGGPGVRLRDRVRKKAGK
jgi:hypothetical protein